MRNGVPVFENSKPCRDCTQTLKRMGIKTVVYSTAEGLVCERVRTLHSTHISKGRKVR